MVHSISGKYKDVVCLIPINRIGTVLLRTWFDKVMTSIKKHLLVLAVCADNHVCNRCEAFFYTIFYFLDAVTLY